MTNVGSLAIECYYVSSPNPCIKHILHLTSVLRHFWQAQQQGWLNYQFNIVSVCHSTNKNWNIHFNYGMTNHYRTCKQRQTCIMSIAFGYFFLSCVNNGYFFILWTKLFNKRLAQPTSVMTMLMPTWIDLHWLKYKRWVNHVGLFSCRFICNWLGMDFILMEWIVPCRTLGVTIDPYPYKPTV